MSEKLRKSLIELSIAAINTDYAAKGLAEAFKAQRKNMRRMPYFMFRRFR